MSDFILYSHQKNILDIMSNLLEIWKEWPWAFAKDKGLVSFGNAFLCAIARPCPL